MLITRASKFIYRQASVRMFSRVSPFYIVNEYPKSGGTWLSKMLASALDVSDGRYYPIPFTPSVTQGHYLHSWGMNNVIIIWRDGRDVMVSWYYHCLFENDFDNASLVKIVRRDLGNNKNYTNIKENFSDFIQYSFSKQKHPSFSWGGFVNAWHNKRGVVYIKYEDLRNNTEEEIQRLCYDVSGKYISNEIALEVKEAFSFKNMSGREAGKEKRGSFLRKGIIGDWKNHFDESSYDLFCKFAAKEMKLLGYDV